MKKMYILEAALLIIFVIGCSGGGSDSTSTLPSLPKTGQTVCFDAVGGVISCTSTGQDGDMQTGHTWPSPRFTDNGDETITDRLTGLMWAQYGNAPGPACLPGVTKTWQDALVYTACLNTNNYLGHSDWRLPNVNELESLVHFGQSNPDTWLIAQGFSDVQNNWYWSSTTYRTTTSEAWVVNMLNGIVSSGGKAANNYVWPVRAGL